MVCSTANVITPPMQASFDATVTRLAQTWLVLASGRAALSEFERSWARERSVLDAAALCWAPGACPDLTSERHSREARKEALRVALREAKGLPSFTRRPIVTKGKLTRAERVRSDLAAVSARAAASIPARKGRTTRQRARLNGVQESTGDTVGSNESVDHEAAVEDPKGVWPVFRLTSS